MDGLAIPFEYDLQDIDNQELEVGESDHFGPRQAVQELNTTLRKTSAHLHGGSNTLEKKGAPGGSRTPNRLIRSQVLYPLSYRRALVHHYNGNRRDGEVGIYMGFHAGDALRHEPSLHLDKDYLKLYNIDK